MTLILSSGFQAVDLRNFRKKSISKGSKLVKSFVDYLIFDENNKVILKNTHKYYTQIQLSMYVVGVKMCHFFVYSIQQYVYLSIERDEEYLSLVFPKIEKKIF